MIRKLMLILAVVALGLVASTAPTPATAQTGETSQLRFVHGIQSAGAVDIYLNNNLVVAGAAFGNATPHLAIPVGDYEVSLRSAGATPDSTPLLGGKLVVTALRQGVRQTVVFHNDASGLPTYTTVDDDVNPSQLGQARLHVIHTAGGVGSVDLFGTNGAPITQGLNFAVPSGTVNLPVSSWDLVLITSGGNVEEPLAAIGRVNFNTNMLYTFVVVGTPTSPQVLTLSTPLNADPAVSTVFTQIGHGSTDAPTVDIYANDVKIIAGLNPGDVTPHLPLPAGEIALTVREAGSPPNSTPAAEATLNLTSTTGAASVIAVGELAGGSFIFSVYESNIANMDSAKARIQVINTLALGTASASLSNGTILSDSIAVFGASTPLDVAPGTYGLTAKVAEGEFALPTQAYNGGTYYTALLYANVEAGLSLGTTALKLEQNSLPGSVISANRIDAVANANGGSEVASNPIQTPPPVPTTVEVAGVTTVVAPAAPPAAPPVQSTLDTRVRGIVNLNSGSNLQCREYPSAEAFSLGLIPNGAELEIRGYAGPADPEVDTPFIPVDPELFEDPTAAEDFADIWMSAYWTASDGGTVDCWVRADYLILSFRNRSIREPEDFFALLEMDVPIPIFREVPFNYPGEVVDSTIVTPPTAVKNEDIATVNLNSGVNLHLRRYPDPTSESLALIPNGTDVIILGRTPISLSEITPEEDDDDEDTEGEPTPSPTPILLETAWLFVEFTNPVDGSITTGWISSQYATLSKAGRKLELIDIEAISPTTFGEKLSGPSVVSTVPSNQPASGPVVGVINIPAGSNLNMYDAPSINGGLVRSLGAGATVNVLGRTADSNWLNVRYEVIGEGVWVGWVSNTGGWVVIPVAVESLPITG